MREANRSAGRHDQGLPGGIVTALGKVHRRRFVKDIKAGNIPVNGTTGEVRWYCIAPVARAADAPIRPRLSPTWRPTKPDGQRCRHG
jgi:hypothetical protein